MNELQVRFVFYTMKIRIIEKLNQFLNERPSIKEESEVVYLLVELRKLLDREREDGKLDTFDLVRFHADWVVHTRKDRITPSMEKIMTQIDESIDIYPKNGDINFLLLPAFRKELQQLLSEYALPNEFCKSENSWMDFMLALAQILADQPIINPTDNIEEFRFIDIKREGIMANIDFKGAKAGESITLGFGL